MFKILPEFKFNIHFNLISIVTFFTNNISNQKATTSIKITLQTNKQPAKQFTDN